LTLLHIFSRSYFQTLRFQTTTKHATKNNVNNRPILLASKKLQLDRTRHLNTNIQGAAKTVGLQRIFAIVSAVS